MSEAVDPMRAYMDARKAFDQTQTTVQNSLAVVFKVAKLMGERPHAFLAGHMNLGDLPPDEGRVDAKDMRFSIADWPDLTALRNTMALLHGAFFKMHKAWSDLPQADQRMMSGSAPPKQLNLRPN